MIKNINKQNILTTPFVAEKQWSLYNIQNDDVILVEENTPSEGSISVALDYIDYYISSPILNSDCNIALEQQDADEINYQEGENLSGIFYPNTDPQNIDGTYKRLVHAQTRATFYNNYRNPTLLFGMENIDFQLSRTQRYISDFLRIFNVPQHIFGDKMAEGTIQLYDNSLDDNVVITDDSHGNLVASSNLFSKIQEVRVFGNDFISGSYSHDCPPTIVPTTTTTTSTSTSTTTTSTSTSTSTTSTSTTSTSTTSTSTSTSTTSTTPTTTTSTTSTSTSTTPTTTTSTTPTTTTSTTSTTTSTSTSTTSTSTTSTTTPPPCEIYEDCSTYSADPITIVHWYTHIDCGGTPVCKCVTSTCNLFDTCDRLINGPYPIQGINIVPGDSSCMEETEIPPVYCKPGRGQNKPSHYDACFLPIIELLELCGWTFSEVGQLIECQYTVDITPIQPPP